jgi:hypothetical protein
MSAIPEQPRGEHRMRPGRQTVLFSDFRDKNSGTTEGGREWFISPTTLGWRLEFMDPGDDQATYAGTFATIGAAKREALR